MRQIRMEKGIIIKNTVIVGVILTMVFLSQQPYWSQYAARDTQQPYQYLNGPEKWFKTTFWPQVEREAGRVQAVVAQEVTKQKNNFAQNIWEKFKNYFAQKFNHTFQTNVE